MLRCVSALLALMAVSGCATVVRGTTEQVAFDTTPSGAEVRVVTSGPMTPATSAAMPTMACVTPCVLQVRRAERMAVTVTKTGFETESFALDPQVSGEGAGAGILGNALIGGVIGVGVDAVSGATLDHCPNPVRFALRPVHAAAARGRSAPAESPAMSFDPVEGCKQQTAAKYKAAEPSATGVPTQ